jgi:hypothetical protein
MDDKKPKKHYETPEIRHIKLDAKCAVLGFCQNTGQGGPVVVNCGDGIGGNCLDLGS